MSCTLIPLINLDSKPSKTDGECVGSTKKQCTCSPKSCFIPNVIPPGDPPTPQGKYRNNGFSASTVIAASVNCFCKRAAAVLYPKNKFSESSSSTKYPFG